MFIPFGFVQYTPITFNIVSTGSLYDFTTFTFTTAGVSGSAPPTFQRLLAAYTGSAPGIYFTTASNFTTGSFQGYQIWTVPQTATYEVEVAGAASGLTNYPTPAGRYTNGAIIKGRVSLTQGQKFVMVVGQRSLNATTSATAYNGIGGGGGTYFVLSGSNTPYLVAGGAGGPGAYSGDVMGQGGILKSGSLNGNGSTSTTGSLSKNNAPGGSGSYGGRSHINTGSLVSSNVYDSGGGGGFLGSGYNGLNVIANTTNNSTGGGGLAFLSGSTGGVAATTFTPNQATQGGFGGGGGGTPIAGGGGGGYSGGGGAWGSGQPASDGGGGGGSYINSSVTFISTSNGLYDGLSSFNGSAITNLNLFNTGSGYIKITKL